MSVAMLGLAVVVIGAAAGTAVSGDNVTVMTWDGPVTGVANIRGVSWRGIPYAAAPVGDLRWKHPTRPMAWTTPIEASTFGPACPQRCVLPPLACQAAVSEDCLFVNVFRPARDGTTAPTLPTLAWIHGGRFEQGSEGVEVYDGQIMANQTGSCVVTINYRIGALAFMVYGDTIQGNFGVLDQRFALQWIQANGKAFGCDPAQVTIFGQSAGGASVLFHMTSPASFPLYSAVIAESTPLALPVETIPVATKHYAHVVDETGCPAKNAEVCLRNLTWQAVVDAQIKAQQKLYPTLPLSMFMPYGPVVNGVELTASPIDLVNQGKANKVPLIIGHVANEALLFVFEAFVKPLNKIEADVILRGIFNGKDIYKQLIVQYPWPEPAPDDYRNFITEIASDFVIACPSRNVSNAMANLGSPVFRYMFNHSWSIKGLWGPDYPFCEGQPCHGVELPFVFSSAPLINPPVQFDADEIILAKRVTDYWGAFAHNSNPKVADAPEWPRHTSATDELMVLQAPLPTPANHPRADYCDFWDRMGYQFN